MQKINVLIIDPIQLPSLSEYIQSEIFHYAVGRRQAWRTGVKALKFQRSNVQLPR